jgi:hypothetical protein
VIVSFIVVEVVIFMQINSLICGQRNDYSLEIKIRFIYRLAILLKIYSLFT